MSPDAQEELHTMAEKTMETLQLSLEAFRRRDLTKIKEINNMEQQVDEMKKQYMNRHIDRLQDKSCDPQVGVVFTNMVATLERIADHATNIAFSIEERD